MLSNKDKDWQAYTDQRFSNRQVCFRLLNDKAAPIGHRQLGVLTGDERFDLYVGGLRLGQLVELQGLTGSGKTTQLLHNANALRYAVGPPEKTAIIVVSYETTNLAAVADRVGLEWQSDPLVCFVHETDGSTRSFRDGVRNACSEALQNEAGEADNIIFCFDGLYATPEPDAASKILALNALLPLFNCAVVFTSQAYLFNPSASHGQ